MTEELARTTQQFGFLLLPDFALMSHASATEPLRAANLLANRSLYAVRQLSLGGVAVRSSGGVLRRVQTGVVRMYAAFIGIGLVAVLAWFLLRGLL